MTNSILLGLLLFFGSWSEDRKQVSSCDILEINVFMIGNEVNIRQAIYWRQVAGDSEMAVVGWRDLGRGGEITFRDGYYYDTFIARNGKIREIRAKGLSMTFTSYDPERLNRKDFPESMTEPMFVTRKYFSRNVID